MAEQLFHHKKVIIRPSHNPYNNSSIDYSNWEHWTAEEWYKVFVKDWNNDAITAEKCCNATVYYSRDDRDIGCCRLKDHKGPHCVSLAYQLKSFMKDNNGKIMAWE